MSSAASRHTGGHHHPADPNRGRDDMKKPSSSRAPPRGPDAKKLQPSDQDSDPGGLHGAPPPSSRPSSHRRTTSANPRPASRASAVETRTERTFITQLDTMVKRTRSPDRTGRPERPTDRRAGGAETAGPRQKEARAESPSQAAAAWCPQATLVPHTTAPLASRISIPPLASAAPLTLQPSPLSELSLQTQEAVLLEDLLYVFMGFEGQYIRFDKAYNPTEERDRLAGPTFRILPGLDPSLQDLAQSMLKMAAYYSALEAFVDVQSREEFGAVNHALCASVRRILAEYLAMIVQLEGQLLDRDSSFTIHVLNVHILPTSKMMFHLHSLAHELLRRNALLDDETDDEASDDDDSGDDFENILESLREGGDLMPGNMTGKKICKGGVVLGLITGRLEAMAGDPVARALLATLLRDASRPYVAMLNEWLHHGSINDPHAEFLIKEQKSIRRERLEQDYTDDYWEKRYILREHDVPPQLEGVRDRVLLAGKYLNVVRECGGVDDHDVGNEVRDAPVTFDDDRFLDNVNGAYAHANESLMQLLLTTHALPDRLRSLKHYFFLDPSDYFSYFLDLAASELRKPVKSVNTGKLQSLLDLVLRQPGSAVSLDPFKEDVKVEMNEITLIKSLQRVVNITGIEQGEALQPPPPSQLPPGTSAAAAAAAAAADRQMDSSHDKNATGFTSLQLDYSVPFPVSLVISRKTIWRYQALFRYLLSLRHLESQLSATWQTQTRGVAWAHRTSSSPRLEVWKRRVWTLRARMLVFVQQLLYFCTAEVIEPNWQRFMSRLRTSSERSGGGGEEGTAGPPRTRTVDELMQDHVDFLDTCLKECMMTNSKLLRIHSKLMQTCTVFATYSNWLSRELEKADPDLCGTAKPPGMTEDQWRRLQAAKSAAASSSGAAAADTSTMSAGVGAGEDAEKRAVNLFEIIRKWESNFSRHLQILLDALNHYAATETVVLLGLCARLSTANQGTEYAGLRHDEEAGG